MKLLFQNWKCQLQFGLEKVTPKKVIQNEIIALRKNGQLFLQCYFPNQNSLPFQAALNPGGHNSINKNQNTYIVSDIFSFQSLNLSGGQLQLSSPHSPSLQLWLMLNSLWLFFFRLHYMLGKLNMDFNALCSLALKYIKQEFHLDTIKSQ